MLFPGQPSLRGVTSEHCRVPTRVADIQVLGRNGGDDGGAHGRRFHRLDKQHVEKRIGSLSSRSKKRESVLRLPPASKNEGRGCCRGLAGTIQAGNNSRYLVGIQDKTTGNQRREQWWKKRWLVVNTPNEGTTAQRQPQQEQWRDNDNRDKRPADGPDDGGERAGLEGGLPHPF